MRRAGGEQARGHVAQTQLGHQLPPVALPCTHHLVAGLVHTAALWRAGAWTQAVRPSSRYCAVTADGCRNCPPSHSPPSTRASRNRCQYAIAMPALDLTSRYFPPSRPEFGCGGSKTASVWSARKKDTTNLLREGGTRRLELPLPYSAGASLGRHGRCPSLAHRRPASMLMSFLPSAGSSTA